MANEKAKPVKKTKKSKPVKKNRNNITVESDDNTPEINETKYSEKLKNLLAKIKNQSHTDTEVKIRFGWKSN